MNLRNLISTQLPISAPIDIFFVRWSWIRALLHNGWWLVASLYLVIDAGLTPAQLVVIGVMQGIAALLFELPAGVVADTMSRKWSVVLSHLLMGIAMIATGLVTSFAALIVTQMLWGIAWTFASGADVALLTDELDQPQRIARVLARTARAQLAGAAVGIVLVGLLAWATSLRLALILAGTAMLLLGVYFALRVRETRFVHARQQRWLASWRIFKNGIALVSKSRAIMLIFVATFLVNGAADASTRLFPKQLVDIGLPSAPQPIVWLTGLSFLALLVGAAALRIVEARIQGAGAARRDYLLASLGGAIGLVLLATAPNILVGGAAVLLISGIALPLTRTLATIQVNSLTTNTVRSTVHSFLAQAEYLGEIACGIAIGLLAQATTLAIALLGCAALFAATVLLILRSRTDWEPADARGSEPPAP